MAVYLGFFLFQFVDAKQKIASYFFSIQLVSRIVLQMIVLPGLFHFNWFNNIMNLVGSMIADSIVSSFDLIKTICNGQFTDCFFHCFFSEHLLSNSIPFCFGKRFTL